MTAPLWLELLRADVAVSGSIAKTARRVGVSRAAVSTALAGKYPAKTGRLEAKVLIALQRVDCPFLARQITSKQCTAYRERPMPRSNPREVQHWGCCQRCEIGARIAGAEKKASVHG